MVKNTFIRGALLLTICALIGKVIGAFYRIPFAMIVGPEGVGLYQMVYPLYALILTISTSGLPSSISKLLSGSYAEGKYYQAKKYFKYSFSIIIIFSAIGFLSILCFSGLISNLQGNADAKWCYVAISPAVLFAGVVAGVRGYFQSRENMFPTALSGLIEQICKVAIGLVLAYLLKGKGVVVATVGAIVGVSASELLASLFLLVCYHFSEKKMPQVLSQTKLDLSKKQMIKNIFKISLPIALGSLIMPLTMVIDSTLIVRLLSKIFDTQKATTLFGIQSGVVGSLINLPIVASIAAQTILLPRITREKTQNNIASTSKTIKNALFFVLIVAIPCAICYFVFSKQIISILYIKSFSAEQINIASRLLQIGAFNIVALSIAQTSAGILQGLGKINTPVVTLLVGAIIKVGSVVLLVPNAKIGIYGAEISDIICFAVVSFINFVVIHKHAKYNFVKEFVELMLVCGGVGVCAFFSNYVLLKMVGENSALVIGGLLTLVIYSISIIIVIKNKTKRPLFFAFRRK